MATMAYTEGERNLNIEENKARKKTSQSYKKNFNTLFFNKDNMHVNTSQQYYPIVEYQGC